MPIDINGMLNAIHVPKDAGQHESVLRALLERIPDGWGARCGDLGFSVAGTGFEPALCRVMSQTVSSAS